MAGYVLDASVIVEIFVSGTYADEGLQLLERADMRLANGVAGKPFQVVHVSAAVPL